jgi:gluconate 2-dehydrogenase gamma chain
MTRRRRLPIQPEDETALRLSRRGFLVTGGAAAAGVVFTQCTNPAELGEVEGPSSSSTTTPTSRARRFFNVREAALVEAATARILPGTPDDPGAREAEVVVYIDGLLETGGFASEPIYTSGPFLTPDEIAAGDPGDEEEGGGGGGDDVASAGGGEQIDTTAYGVVRLPVNQWDRYGMQSMFTPAQIYRSGLVSMDAHAQSRFGAGFVELPEGQQDEVLADMQNGRAPTFDQPSGPDLFALLRQHTLEGMFSDPIYGGNRDMVGWSLIGWPAAQRAYTVDELRGDGAPRRPQSIQDLPHAHGNIAQREEPVLPLAGSEQRGGRSGNQAD